MKLIKFHQLWGVAMSNIRNNFALRMNDKTGHIFSLEM